MTDNLLRRSLSEPETLLMPNVWDVGTTRIASAAGFRVIGTSSAAIATMLGGEDAEGTGRDEMLVWASRIIRAAEPNSVNVDLESGYGFTAAELVDIVRDLGCGGINLEDTNHTNSRLRKVEAQADRLRTLAAGFADLPDHPVLTARVDSMLEVLHHHGHGNSTAADNAVDDAIDRARAYLDAGADIVFPIALHTPRQFRRFLRHIPAERTALLVPIADARLGIVRGLGVSRISFGGTTREVADTHLRRRIEALQPPTNPVHRILDRARIGIGRLLRP